MNSSHDLSQFFNKLSPSLYDPGSVRDQLIVPHVQSICQLRELPDILEKFVSLFNDLIIVIKVMKLRGVQLTEFHVHETSPLSRTVLYNTEILR